MKTITLKNNRGICLVDDEDYSELMKYQWYALTLKSGYVYAYRFTGLTSDKSRKNIFIHQQILGYPDSDIDHKNGNPLDCQKSNLRLCSHSQNLQNRKCWAKSGYKGVYPCRNSYQALISIDGKTTHIGMFDKAEDAALAFDDKARELHGEFCCVNFPKEGEQGAI